MSRNPKKVSVGGDLLQALIGLTVIVLAQASIYDRTELWLLSVILILVIIAVRLSAPDPSTPQ